MRDIKKKHRARYRLSYFPNPKNMCPLLPNDQSRIPSGSKSVTSGPKEISNVKLGEMYVDAFNEWCLSEEGKDWDGLAL